MSTLRNERTASAPQPNLRVVSLGLTLSIVALHVTRVFTAGGLWRDEAAAVQLTSSATLGEIFQRFPHEAFPPPYFFFLRCWSAIFGTGDHSYRFLGLLVGLATITALWWVCWTVRKTPPLISLALVGFNSAFLMWGDEMRGYGLGVLFVILSLGFIWRMLERGNVGSLLAALVCSVCATQVLIHNFVLITALCCGVTAVAWKRSQWRTAAYGFVIWIATLTLLLPYSVALRSARDWDVVVQTGAVAENVLRRLMEAMGASGLWNIPVWIVLLAVVVVFGLLSAGSLKAMRPWRPVSDLLAFFAVTCLFAVGLFLIFLATLKYPTQSWYYLALLGLVAVLGDIALQSAQSTRSFGIGIAAVSMAIALASLPMTLRAVVTSMTNVDVIAADLEKRASKGDLIVVMPWQLGISFNRYYRGTADWITVPPIPFHLYHRYELVKAQMTAPDQDQPIRPAMDKIKTTFEMGHSVFVVSLVPAVQPVGSVPTMVPAPQGEHGWNEQTHTGAWCIKTLAYIQGQALKSKVLMPNQTNHMNRFEDLALTSFSGH